MALLRSSLKYLVKQIRFDPSTHRELTPSLFKFQERMFSTSKVLSKEQMEELEKNPFFDKYKDKIAQLQKKNPEEFLARIEAKTSKEAAASAAAKPKEFSLPGAAKQKLEVGHQQSSKKSLDSIVKLELLADKSAKEIEEIWCKHYLEKDAVAAVIPTATFQVMQERFQQFNTFLFPLPRDQGYEFFVVQFLGQEAHFTSLINYQAHKENAPECLNMMHYTEMAESKGIVLMVGEYDKDVLSSTEARCLADQVELYYSRPSAARLDILTKFTSTPTLFSHDDLIAEMNSIQIQDTAAAEVNN